MRYRNISDLGSIPSISKKILNCSKFNIDVELLETSSFEMIAEHTSEQLHRTIHLGEIAKLVRRQSAKLLIVGSSPTLAFNLFIYLIDKRSILNMKGESYGI